MAFAWIAASVCVATAAVGFRHRPQRIRKFRPARTYAERSLRLAGHRDHRRQDRRHRRGHHRGHRHQDPSQDRKTASGSNHSARSPAQVHPRGRSISSCSNSYSNDVFRANAAQQVNLAPVARGVVARMLAEYKRPVFTQRYAPFPCLACFSCESAHNFPLSSGVKSVCAIRRLAMQSFPDHTPLPDCLMNRRPRDS
jgi:hypothetical protein